MAARRCLARPFRFWEISDFNLGPYRSAAQSTLDHAGARRVTRLRAEAACVARVAQVLYRKALIVLGCVMKLLLPTVSASKDLRPGQAVLEG